MKSIVLMHNLMYNSKFEKVQTYLYRNPKISIWLIFKLGAIVLREEYLKEHPKIKE